MVDFITMDKSLKTAWVKRLNEARDNKWCSLFSQYFLSRDFHKI